MGVLLNMKNYLCTITWNTYCNKEDIMGMEKEILKCIKLKFWNVTKLELIFKPTGVENDNGKKT
jgi:hypothetical protein